MPGMRAPERGQSGPKPPSSEGAQDVSATPLQIIAHAPVPTPRSHIVTTLFLVGLYIVISAGLITYNKFLIHKGRFPYAVAVVLIHSGFCSALTGFLYLVKPSLFPSLADGGLASIDKNTIFKGALPVAVLFSGQLVLSNAPYLHSSVAFLQMMKEGNLVLVYVFSLFFALEKFSFRNVGVLCMVLAATSLTIHGEMNFSFVGFAMQGTSQFCESLKLCLQALLLSQAGKKLDPLSYVLLVMPFCFLILGSFCLFLNFGMHLHYIPVPHFADVLAWWPHLLANACVAFALNLCVAVFVKQSSAIAFILAGITKDAAIVTSGAFIMREVISRTQAVGFSCQIACVLLWSLLKTYPDKFEDGVMTGISRLATDGLVHAGLRTRKSKMNADYGSVSA